jgi:hypothetical protein
MPEIITQKIKISAPAGEIFKHLIIWGESSWWPKKSLMRFTKTTPGPIGVGTCYEQQVKLPLGPSWQAYNKIIDRKNLYLRRDFSGSMFEGFEEMTVTLSESGYSEVVYTFAAAEIKGSFNKFLWKHAAKKMHIQNIALIFRALKDSLEGARPSNR